MNSEYQTPPPPHPDPQVSGVKGSDGLANRVKLSGGKMIK